jgi:hypothetical protein
VRAVELPLRGEPTTRHRLSVHSVASSCVVLNTGCASSSSGTSSGVSGDVAAAAVEANVAALATIGLGGGLPGAAARALLGGGSAGVVCAWSLRDGSGCGARLCAPLALGSPLTALLSIGKGIALAGVASGAMLVLVGGSDGWRVAKEVAKCHDGPLLHARLFAPSATDASAATTFATAGADRKLRVWQWDGTPSGEAPSGGTQAEAASCARVAGLTGGEAIALSTTAPLRALTGAHGRPAVLFGVAEDGFVCSWELQPPGAAAASAADAPVATTLAAASLAASAHSGVAIGLRSGPAFVHRGAPPSVALPRR